MNTICTCPFRFGAPYHDLDCPTLTLQTLTTATNPAPTPKVPEGGAGGEGTETDAAEYWPGCSQCTDAGIRVVPADFARALETRLRAVTAEAAELKATERELGISLQRALEATGTAITESDQARAERDTAVAERDGLRDAVAASMVEATKAKREEKEKAETIRCLEVILSKLGIPTGFEDGNSWDDLDVDERLRIFEKEHATLRASLAAARADGERLDWLEATALGKRADSRFFRSIFICVDPSGRLQLDIKLEDVILADSLRAAITAAMKGEGE